MRSPSTRRRRAGRLGLPVAVVLIVAVVGLWGVGLVRFASSIPERVADTTTRTDAIVVLTGGSGRLDEGLKLLAEDRAAKLFVSGVYRGVDVDRLIDISRNTPHELVCCIEIGHTAGNTAGNAAETAAWMRENGFSSLRLVTSVYHLPRSLLEFRHALPDVTMVSHPVFAEHVKRKEWWLWPGTLRLIVGEYNKYLVAAVRQGVELLTGRGTALVGAPAN